MQKSKLVVILGPTATGKTKISVELASVFNGEIISADSRQVYIGLDIGSGKDLKEYTVTKDNGEIIQIPHHLIDIADPKKDFNLADFKKLAQIAIDKISAQHKLPILVGGSGLYLQSVVDGFSLNNASPDEALRESLEDKTIEELFEKINRMNSDFAQKINNSDKNNKRRLIRYIEIIGKNNVFEKNNKESIYDTLIIGINFPKDVIHERIKERLKIRLEKEDLIEEVKRLHEEGLSYRKLESFGLEYRYIALYLQKKLSQKEMFDKLFIAIKQFAKKQMTWFHRWEKMGAKINWVNDIIEAKSLIESFIKK
ncbi:MAG: tRNA (adenosine(37)-N6)-dimethylallyltransferase MiaA [Candidatus Falkowbacteria bacterium]|nr:tRNA (adenosine(37)-N6)-dimethylallyltransferase MiaA [Candidatus Falkowbacteria bacterium]